MTLATVPRMRNARRDDGWTAVGGAVAELVEHRLGFVRPSRQDERLGQSRLGLGQERALRELAALRLSLAQQLHPFVGSTGSGDGTARACW